MKGVIFAELLHWVEKAYSPAVADAIITRSRVASNGVYTSGGNYPHEEALSLIGELAHLTGQPISDLAESYGFWLSRRFVELYPDMFVGYSDTVSLLRAIDTGHHCEMARIHPSARPPSVIAIEAAKLNSDARPPSLVAELDEQALTVSYASHRPFADIALGLMRGYIAYFGDALEVVRDEAEAGPYAARFSLRQRDG